MCIEILKSLKVLIHPHYLLILLRPPCLCSAPSLPVRLPLGLGGCPVEGRWTVSSWGSQFPWWHSLSERRTRWSGGGNDPKEENPHKRRRVKLSVKVAEKEDRCALYSSLMKKNWIILFLSHNFLLCTFIFNTFPWFSCFSTAYFCSTPFLFFVILSTCWCVCSGFTILPLSLSWLSALRQGHSRLGTPLLRSHLLCRTLFHAKSHPLLTFNSVFIGCLSSGLFCSSLCTDGRVRMTKT